MTDDTHDHDHDDVDETPQPQAQARFIPASMIAAQMCVWCGSLVAGEGKQPHLDFHRTIFELQEKVALNGGAAKKKGKKK